VLEDNTSGQSHPIRSRKQYHFAHIGAGVNRLQRGQTKSVVISDEHLRGHFHFNVIIDDVRLADEKEIETGKPFQQGIKRSVVPDVIAEIIYPCAFLLKVL
jgi:hypothetical protein